MNKKKTFAWIAPVVEVKNTPQYGNGLFAKRNIKKGTLIIVFGGYVFTRAEEETLPERIRDSAIQIDRDLVIGVKNVDELGDMDYVNHSCDPNTGIKGQISLVARKDIKKGEEITFDYGTVLFRAKGGPKHEMECLCGVKNCRGKITQFDWKLSGVQKKYKGFFPYYIQEEIDKIKNKSHA